MKRPTLSAQISSASHGLRALVRSLQQARYTVAVIGESGSGKSSLINAMMGQYVAPIGAIETTMEAKPYNLPHANIQLVDLPGCGTHTWPADSYFEDLHLANYDAVIFVYSARVKTDDITLFHALRGHGSRIYVVRNYFDVAVEGESTRPKKQRLNMDELRASIADDARAQFSAEESLNTDALRVYMLSSHPNTPSYDLDELLHTLTVDARGFPKERIARYIHTLTQPLEGASMLARARFFARLAANTATLSVPRSPLTVGMLVARAAVSTPRARPSSNHPRT